MSHLALSKPAGVGGAEVGLEEEGQTGVKPHTQIAGVTTGVIRAKGQPRSPAEALSHLNHLPKMWHGICSRLEPRYCPAAVNSFPSMQRKHKSLKLSLHVPAETNSITPVKVACFAESHSMTGRGSSWSTFCKECLLAITSILKPQSQTWSCCRDQRSLYGDMSTLMALCKVRSLPKRCTSGLRATTCSRSCQFVAW